MTTAAIYGPEAGHALDSTMFPEDVRTRFWAAVTAAGDCWMWTGSKLSSGYGVFRWEVAGTVTRFRAHRVAFALAVAPVPAGLVVGHVCDQPGCVNPGHLWLGTQAANNLDSSRKGRSPNAAKTHCSNGHEYDEVNTYFRSDGGRGCRPCRAAAQRRFKESNS